jgi:hypothetical protein
VFVLTHHAREPLVKEAGTTFTLRDRGPDRVQLEVIGAIDCPAVTHVKYRVVK